jgi:hypothetical protein
LNIQTESNINQLAGDVHLLTSPIRFLFRCVLALLFLLAAPLLYATIPYVCIWAENRLSGHLGRIPGEGLHPHSWLAMGKFSPTKQHGDCEEIANPSTAFGRRRRNWIDAHGAVPEGQIVDASCGNKHCITLKHAYLRPRAEQPGTYRKIADRVHRLKVGQHFDIRGVGTDERSRNRFRSGLYAAARMDKVSVRGQPDGSVRVTKVGEWSSVGA